MGLNPALMSRREKLLYLLRLVPLAEANFNCVELAPRETGKTYLYRNVSYYSHVLSGGKATPAGLFINNATGKVGIVGSRDAVVFDEIANTDFTDPKALVSIMQGYMQDAKFSRGKKEILAFASIVMVGNLDVQNKLPHEKYYHLFEPLPDFLQVEAFIDRIHCYTPGWEIPKIKPDSMSQDYGFITDYFAEIMHELRRMDVLGPLKDRYQLVDLSAAGTGITGPRRARRREDAFRPAETDVRARRGQRRATWRATVVGHRGTPAGPQSASSDGPRRIRPHRPGGEAHPVGPDDHAHAARRQPAAARHAAQQAHAWAKSSAWRSSATTGAASSTSRSRHRRAPAGSSASVPCRG